MINTRLNQHPAASFQPMKSRVSLPASQTLIMAGSHSEINSGLEVSFDFAVRDSEEEPECDINKRDGGRGPVIAGIALCSANQENAGSTRR
jgi:hypothetical protein